MHEITELQKRWDTPDGCISKEKILRERFFLSLSEKDKIARNTTGDLIHDLRGIDLSNLELTGFILSDTDLRYGVFSRSKIYGPFSYTDISFSDFSFAEIMLSIFFRATARYCNFNESYVNDTDFNEVDLRGSSFGSVKLDNVGFYNSDLRSVSFESASFNRCNFVSVKLDAKDKEMWLSFKDGECEFQNIEWCELEK